MKQFLLSLALLTALTSSAQVTYGPKLGLNFSKVKFSSDVHESGFKAGVFFGGYLNYAVNSNFSVQPELYYSMEGGKDKNTFSSNSGVIKSGFLQLPVLVKYTAASGFFGEAGPQIGFLLSNKEKWNGENVDIKEYYKSIEFRFPIGIGYKFSDAVSADLRYSAGFSAINKDAVGGGKLKNNVFSLGIQYNLVK
jgi:hypothetical protein